MATLLEELQAANLPVISATDAGAVTMQAMTEQQQITFSNVLLARFNPVLFAQVQADAADRQDIKAKYAAGITQLQNIEAMSSTTVAGLLVQVKNIATLLRVLLKYLSKDFRN